MAEDSSKEMFEFFQKMWNPMSFPIPGMFQPTMSVEEVEKKIVELQSVENWLKMNLSFVQMTVKTLEMQKSALETIQESAKGCDGAEARRQEAEQASPLTSAYPSVQPLHQAQSVAERVAHHRLGAPT